MFRIDVDKQQILDRTFESLTLEIWLNGLYSAVFRVTLAGFYTRRKYKSNGDWFLIFITIVMYIFSTVHIANRWWNYHQAFVFNEGADVVRKLETIPFFWTAINVTVFSANTLHNRGLPFRIL
ncbi:hypothetical protein K439DRAFT_965459 [Ramaria rubella]|nr:hypothetical protein K439DRAFT_965459 [Ramaria rubella]